MRDEIGVMTKNVETLNANTATCTEFAVASSQHETVTRDTGCDGEPRIMTVNGGNQMEAPEQSTQEVECNILVPGSESDEEYIQEHIPCFKCKGA